MVRNPNWFGLLFVLWILGISTLSLISFDLEDGPDIDLPFTDKIVHFAFHCIAMLLGGLSLRKQVGHKVRPRRPLTFLTIGLILYGMLIEGLQAIMPTGRSAELLDVFANSLGLGMGLVLLKLIFEKSSYLKWQDKLHI